MSLTIPDKWKHLPVAVCCVIRNDEGQILLVSRKDDPTSFGLPGGKVDLGETPQEAIIREVKEETGLDIVLGPAIFQQMCPKHAPEEEGGQDFYAFAFVALSYSGDISSDEAGLVKWGSWKDQENGQFAEYNKGVRKQLATYDHRLKVGDKRWYIPGYRGPGLIAILCTIKEVDTTYRDQHFDGVIFYWLDEPIGHAVTEDALLRGDPAMEVLMNRYDEAQKEAEEYGDSEEGNTTLVEFRDEGEYTIQRSWTLNGDTHPGFEAREEKEPWKGWINPQMILGLRKKPIKGSAIQFEGKTYVVLAPGRHGHVIQKIVAENPDIPGVAGEIQGFITQDDRFVDRIEGAKIALETGQIEKLNWPPNLYSEDLW